MEAYEKWDKEDDMVQVNKLQREKSKLKSFKSYR